MEKYSGIVNDLYLANDQVKYFAKFCELHQRKVFRSRFHKLQVTSGARSFHDHRYCRHYVAMVVTLCMLCETGI